MAVKAPGVSAMRPARSLLLVLALTALLAACGTPLSLESALPPDPTPQAYISASSGRAILVPAGQYVLAGRHMACAGRPTILDPGLNDYAAVYPKFIIVNPPLLDKTSTPVKLWTYEHECGHVVRGWNLEKGADQTDTAKADCYGIEKGRREGWLTPKGLDQICDFIKPGQPDEMHRSGPERCAAMRACYANAARSASRR
jgi:hypothetical protein